MRDWVLSFEQAEESNSPRGKKGWFKCPPLPLSPTPLDKTTKHLTRLTNYISQVIANPARGRGLTHIADFGFGFGFGFGFSFDFDFDFYFNSPAAAPVMI